MPMASVATPMTFSPALYDAAYFASSFGSVPSPRPDALTRVTAYFSQRNSTQIRSSCQSMAPIIVEIQQVRTRQQSGHGVEETISMTSKSVRPASKAEFKKMPPQIVESDGKGKT